MKQTTSCKNLIEIKISVRWIQELSILLVSGMDMSRCKTGTKPDVVIKYAKMLAKEWQEDKGRFAVIQYIPTITNGQIIFCSLAISGNSNSLKITPLLLEPSLLNDQSLKN